MDTQVGFMVPLKTLAAQLGRERTTVWRLLRARGIRAVGHSVELSELQSKWPELGHHLAGRMPRCGSCGSVCALVCHRCG